jgi:hypothetical protein
MAYLPIEVCSISDGKILSRVWYAAFKDRWYGDYVIEFSKKFSSVEEVNEAVAKGEVYYNMPCPHNGK